MKKAFHKWYTLITYLVVGGFTTLINIVSFWLLTVPIPVNYVIANTVAWVLSVLFAYVANKIIVFQSKTENKTETIREFVSFIGFRFVSYAMDLAVMILLISGLHMNETLSKILTNVVVLVANFIFSKWFIFRNAKEREAVGNGKTNS
ncbi:GtrA family protein [Pullulanibacillus sp. KACC 23026]|uniref:GtrA family protein n=1 Tax=Pullulanibacillus sp. KACC 23026 TaxID=3028315 RepID=UPI0023B081C9|nr:GtrA family protein [Pullulanibacillus sp. KACC 23026]WEG12194.1 GtrA family protein [Pullulanibacillus sp. KACC 23026]